MFSKRSCFCKIKSMFVYNIVNYRYFLVNLKMQFWYLTRIRSFLWIFCCIFFSDTPLPRGLPSVLCLKDLVKNFLSIQCVPKRYFFELLSHFTTSELEEERLVEFCSAEGQVREISENLKNKFLRNVIYSVKQLRFSDILPKFSGRFFFFSSKVFLTYFPVTIDNYSSLLIFL